MAIKKQIAFEGLTYNLDDRDRVAAASAEVSFKHGIQRSTADAAITVGASTTLLVLAADTTSSRIVTMPSASAGRYFRVIWEVEQATSDLLLLMVKSVQSLEVHLKRVQVPQILGLVN